MNETIITATRPLFEIQADLRSLPGIRLSPADLAFQERLKRERRKSVHLAVQKERRIPYVGPIKAPNPYKPSIRHSGPGVDPDRHTWYKLSPIRNYVEGKAVTEVEPVEPIEPKYDLDPDISMVAPKRQKEADLFFRAWSRGNWEDGQKKLVAGRGAEKNESRKRVLIYRPGRNFGSDVLEIGDGAGETYALPMGAITAALHTSPAENNIYFQRPVNDSGEVDPLGARKLFDLLNELAIGGDLPGFDDIYIPPARAARKA